MAGQEAIGAGDLDRLTIVTPSFEKHSVQFGRLVESLTDFCLDTDALHLIVVVEHVNEALFSSILARYPQISSEILLTEDVLGGFGAIETPAQFLRRAGKFTFQTLKKFGALVRAQTAWSLVLDSESLFHKPFRALDLLRHYAEQKYVFYTRTRARTDLWLQSTGSAVTRNAAAALAMDAGDRWYMEYFHWFYETNKVRDLVENCLGEAFYDLVRRPGAEPADHFECILYYLYIEKYHSKEYALIDLKAEIDAVLPTKIARRFNLAELPFSLFGNEYILNIIRPEEVRCLKTIFDKYRLPFIRLEPPFFDTRYLPELCALPSFVATISSHHLVWLRKRIAVCVSGEFRHVVHRNPEHNLRHLVGFLAGVDCDVFVHGWSNTSEALVVEVLKPRDWLFEPRPNVKALADRIRVVEPNIKPGRDVGSLAMFYSLNACFELLEPHLDEYDFVLRIRPDIFSDRSLKEILIAITDEGDYLPDAIYVPQHFHSKGINDQFALGPTQQIAIYLKTYRWIEERIETLFFNPETVLLTHLVDRGVPIALANVPYALMRHDPMRIDSVHHHLHEQEHVWWSRTDRLPLYQDLTAFFRDKLKAIDAIIRRELPDVLEVEVPASATPPADGGCATVRARTVDNDPALVSIAFLQRHGFLWLSAFELRNDGVWPRRDRHQHYLFAYPEGDDVVFSEWRMDGARLVNNKLRCPHAALNHAAGHDRVRRALAWLVYRLSRREKGQRIIRLAANFLRHARRLAWR